MYFLVEFNHKVTSSESINGGEWQDTSHWINTNKLVQAPTFVRACAALERLDRWREMQDFKDLTITE